MASERPPADGQEPEWVPEDDAIIGRAVRWSLLALAAVGLLAAIAYLALRPSAAVEVVRPKDPGAIPDRAQSVARMPEVAFVDIAERAGIRFSHTSGARGAKLLPETMGGGCAFFDYDGDGDQDLLLINSAWWPGEAPGGVQPTHALYRNDGKGRFEDVTAAAGLNFSSYGMGVAIADYDGDGDQDLFITNLGRNRLLRNDGGRFVDVTGQAGVGGEEIWSTSAGFFDYDNDGDLDLYVANYVRWSKQVDLDLNFTLNGTDRAYGPPNNYEGVHPYLYRNDGDGRFTDVTAAAGLQVNHPDFPRPMAKALGVVFVDVDGDTHLDIFVANDTVQNLLFRNKGDGTFEEIGAVAGVGFDGAGNATGAMGIDVAHYRNDDHLGVAIGNFANEMTSLFVAQRRGLSFTDEAIGEGVGAPSRLFLSFGLFFFDYDLDGRLDLLQANGHLENEISQVQASQSYRQRAQLFWNAGPEERACYSEVPPERLGDLARPIVGRGAAFADIDGDGDLDVVLTQVDGPALLLRNDQVLGHHWLRVKLAGTGPNRDGIGAWIEIEAGSQRQRRAVMPTRSYLSQVELPVTFGLGTAERVDALRVTWPDGTVQSVDVPGVDRTLVVRRAG